MRKIITLAALIGALAATPVMAQNTMGNDGAGNMNGNMNRTQPSHPSTTGQGMNQQQGEPKADGPTATRQGPQPTKPDQPVNKHPGAGTFGNRAQ